MINLNRYENLIARFLNGNISAKEKQQLFNWIDSSSENQHTFLESKDTWDATQQVNMNTESQLLEFYRNKSNSGRNFPLWQKIAAIAAVLFIGLCLGILVPDKNQKEIFATNTLSVPLGSKSEVILPDGSKVQLNSGSTLIYPENFTENNRNVVLNGEAYFKVESNKEKPFTVKTNDFTVTVTGTEFNVSNYTEDNFISTTLVCGIVDLKFNNQSSSARLKPGEKLYYNRNKKKAVIVQADIEMETAWKSGEFIFKEIAFVDLVKKLERWYNVKLITDDNRFVEYKYTGKFKNQETIWQVLDALELTSPITYERIEFREFKLKYKPMQ